MDESLKRIRTPVKEHLRQIRYQLLPVLVFLVGAYAAGHLWTRHITLPNAVGEVQAERVDIISLVDGVLVAGEMGDGESLEWKLYDRVHAGQTVCRLDSRLLDAQMKTIESNVDRLKKQVKAVEKQVQVEAAERKGDQSNELRRLAVYLEQVKLDVATRTITLESNRIDLERRAQRLRVLENLVQGDAESKFVLEDARRAHAMVDKAVVEQEKALKEAKAVRTDAEKRYLDAKKRLSAAFPSRIEDIDAELRVLIAPVQAEVATELARLGEVKVQLRAHAIRIPPNMSGKIVAIYRRPGETVQAGEMIMTVARTRSEHIISYVRSDPRLKPRIGMPVLVQVRTIPSKSAESKVAEVGPQVERVPLQHTRDATVPEWGLPVRISIPPELRDRLRPGELVDIGFLATE